MRDRIEIDKSMIPYAFDILLGAEWFTLEFLYNATADIFTVSLYKNDEVIVYNEPIMYGVTLFSDLYQSGVHPMLDIVPYDESGQESKVSWENFGELVLLTIDQGGDEDEE